MNLTRLNHILIPTTKAERDRFRRKRAGRVLTFMFSWAMMLTEEGLGLFLLWLVSGTLSLNVGITQFYFLWSGLTGLFIVSLLGARRFPLKDVSLSVDAPKRVSVEEEVSFTVGIKNKGDVAHQAIGVHVPFLPWDGTWYQRPEGIQTLGPNELVCRSARAAFSARGAHHLDMFRLSARVPFGFAHGRPVEGKGVRFMVVPKIAKVQRFGMPLAHRYQPGGVALASTTGESRELIGVRPYRPGDPIRDLHAATWARVGEPVVREYRQEYFTRIGVVVDTDGEGRTEAAFEAALSLAAGVVSHLSRGEALVDLLVFGDDVHQLMLGRHLGFLDQALDLLACVESGPSWSSRRLQGHIEPHLSRLSSMVFVALDWDEPRRAFREWIESRGVGFRTLHVLDKRKGSNRDDGRYTALTLSDIDNPEGLWL